MKLGLILGDQLSEDLPTLSALNPDQDLLVFAEVMEEATYVPHHPQKIALIFSAMRHFAKQLEDQGWRCVYHKFDPEAATNTLLEVCQELVQSKSISSLVVTECGEYRLHQQMAHSWSDALGLPVELLADSRFFASKKDFASWAKGRKSLTMEYFYRDLRKKTGLLMAQGQEPEGGEWNYDKSNRKPYRGEPQIPARPEFKQDEIDQAVLQLVATHFDHHLGQLQPFCWGTTRDQALAVLDHFIEHLLPWFGDYQDAMVQDESLLFHSLLSPYINCGLLSPREVCAAVEKAYYAGAVPINAAEGFIRQILGWREYVRGIYWLKMPSYKTENQLGNERDLPTYYWTGDTKMACMKACLTTTFERAYAHHIQRLMVTGNFALLAGIKPEAICEWYLAVYADAYEWVELPNTLGMVMHADGGLLGSKPYAASGNYINKMSDYCTNCVYNVKTGDNEDSCPFNSLYWHFIHRHQTEFSSNNRMTMIYRNFQRMDDNKRDRLLARAETLLASLNEL